MQTKIKKIKISGLATSAVILSLVIGFTSSVHARQNCEKIKNSELIHDQFAISQTAVDAKKTPLQEYQMEKLLRGNEDSAKIFNCQVQLIRQTTDSLAEFLTSLKLYLLDLRRYEQMGNSVEVQNRLAQLVESQNQMINSSEPYLRRLAATIRSLIITEVERLGSKGENLYLAQLDSMKVMPDFKEVIADKSQALLRELQVNFGQNLSVQKISDFYGKREFVKPLAASAGLKGMFLKTESINKDTLKGQIEYLFTGLKAERMFSYANTANFVEHYQTYVIQQIQKNPYHSIQTLLNGVLETEWSRMQKDFGPAMSLIQDMGGFDSRGHFELEVKPIVLLRASELESAKGVIAKMDNPMGQLARYSLLNAMISSWTDLDIAQMQTDLNRVGLLRTANRIRAFSIKNKRAPASLAELSPTELRKSDTVDYFSGAQIRYSKDAQLIWSVGENRKDENGQGDDLSLPLAF